MSSDREREGMGLTGLPLLPDSPIWVIEDDGASGSGQASAIAGRLGLPFRRIGAAGPAGRVRAGSKPELVLSSGLRSAIQSLLLRSRHRCRVVHCADLPALPSRFAGYPFDMMVLPNALSQNPPPSHAAAATPHERPGRAMPVLGPPHVVSPSLLARARDLWRERLGHLPSPRIVVLLGSLAPDPVMAIELAKRLARLAIARRGCVLVSVLAGCPGETADAFTAGMSACLSLTYRDGEPGENPTLGFLGGADMIVAAWTEAQAVSEACAGSVPVYVVPGRGAGNRRLIERLIAAGQVRPLQVDLLGGAALASWTRTPLDEAGRVARAIRRRFMTS